MRLTFLGTAAAEGVPAVFCNCDTCKRAKALGGRDIRTRSQILIDGDTLFDFPMDTYMHMLAGGFDLSAVKRVLITHSHMDHCYPQDFCMRGAPFAINMTEPKVRIFCNKTVRDMFLSDTAREIREEAASGIELCVLHPYDEVTDGDLYIKALPASHTKGEECLVYYIRRGGKGALLLNDTSPLPAEVYARLAKTGAQADIAAFDCTYGPNKHTGGRHMGLPDIVDQLRLIEEAGLASDGMKIYATHFSHNSGLTYDEMCETGRALGIEIAYDGCVAEV